jgi:hypothetical protein
MPIRSLSEALQMPEQLSAARCDINVTLPHNLAATNDTMHRSWILFNF